MSGIWAVAGRDAVGRDAVQHADSDAGCEG